MKGHSLQGSCCCVNKNLDMLNANEEKMIGFLDGIGSSVINDFLVGFIERTLYEDPEIKVAISYIGDLFDAAKG